MGRLFTTRARPGDYLRQYAQAFSAVEGNTTFYSVPAEATVAAWDAATPADFRFLFKFPRAISHDCGLRGVRDLALAFATAVEPLGKKALFWLQLPPWFDDLKALERFVGELPPALPLAVEPRHPRFFDGEALEVAFDGLLADAGADRVLFDTRELHQLVTTDEALRASQRRKPDLPRRTHALGPRPVLRYIGDPTGEADARTLDDWADRVAHWIEEGRTPLVFLHQSPDDAEAPELARAFHARVQARLPDLPDLPRWAGETEPRQLTLFDDLD